MGTPLRARARAATRARAIAAIEAAFAEVRRYDDLLSTWRDDTELARLNAAEPGRPVALPPELIGLLAEAAEWARATGGAFAPTAGPLLDAWDLEGEGRRPGPTALRRAVRSSRPGAFQIDVERGTVTRRAPDGWVTPGAFGKGAALRAARRALERAAVEAALLDFGGQVLVIGAPEDADDWPVGVAHPRHRSEAVLELRLKDVSVATSGASERFVRLEGERVGHIVDPRSGRPVPAWGSVTVVARDPMVADLLSTALFVMGPDSALAWARDRPAIGVLVLVDRTAGVRARASPGLERWLGVPKASGEHPTMEDR